MNRLKNSFILSMLLSLNDRWLDSTSLGALDGMLVSLSDGISVSWVAGHDNILFDNTPLSALDIELDCLLLRNVDGLTDSDNDGFMLGLSNGVEFGRFDGLIEG